MNCKPNDLAVVVKLCDVSGDYLLGRIFKLTEHYTEGGTVYWEYEGPVLQTPWGTLAALADDNLKPLRDPGDDAQDETLQWAPSPTKESLQAFRSTWNEHIACGDPDLMLPMAA
jgi:hypothetical protein